MATLLTMVNDLRVLLREEKTTAISATDEYTQILVKVINRAAQSVLESRVWSFDKRFDGQAAFPGVITASDVIYSSAAPGYMTVDTPEATSTELFVPNALSVRFEITNDIERPGLSYFVVSSIWIAGSVLMTFSPDWEGEDLMTRTDALARFYVSDRVLPDTVRKVLSVRDEEQPYHLRFTEDEIFTDRANPKASDEQGDVRSVVVGGTTTASFDRDTDTAGTVGMRMRVLPVPIEDTMLFYTYVYRHPGMTAATDELADVPDYIIGLIVDHAWLDCLSGNIESDPERAKAVGDQLRFDMMIAERDDRTAPNRRRVLRSRGGGHSTARFGMEARHR